MTLTWRATGSAAIRRLWRDCRAQDMIEYALMVSVLVVGLVAALPPIGSIASTIYSKVVAVCNMASGG